VRRDAACALGPPATLDPWHAQLALGFDSTAKGTRLSLVRHSGPLIVQRALYPEGPTICHAIVVHPPGGIAGGDRLDITVDAAHGAHAVLTTPGAGKLYKGAGRPAVQRVQVHVQPGACVEWLPQETIVFDAAEASLALDLRIEAGGIALAWEICTLGRHAMGERFASGGLCTELAVRCGERLMMQERGEVTGGSPWLDSPIGWRGARTAGSFIAAGATIDNALLEACRDALRPWPQAAAVSRLAPALMVTRFLGGSASEARAAFCAVWTLLRVALTGTIAVPLRIWAT